MNELVQNPAPRFVANKFDHDPIRTAPVRAVMVLGNASPAAYPAGDDDTPRSRFRLRGEKIMWISSYYTLNWALPLKIKSQLNPLKLFSPYGSIIVKDITFFSNSDWSILHFIANYQNYQMDNILQTTLVITWQGSLQLSVTREECFLSLYTSTPIHANARAWKEKALSGYNSQQIPTDNDIHKMLIIIISLRWKHFVIISYLYKIPIINEL